MTDIQRLAQALLEHSIMHNEERGFYSYNACRYCSVHQHWQDDPLVLVHKADCVVPLARKIPQPHTSEKFPGTLPNGSQAISASNTVVVNKRSGYDEKLPGTSKPTW